MSAPLSHNQKRYLSQLAGRAFDRLVMEETERGNEPETTTAARDAFRQAEVIRACGKHGLRCCSQDDYKTVEAHLLDLCGEAGKALTAHVQAATQPYRQAVAVLRRELAAAGLAWNYAETICRAQNRGASIGAISERRVWCLVFTVRNRSRVRQAA